jgi:hypothetical protein
VRSVLAFMSTQANTSSQISHDPWLLAARNAKLLGFTYSGGKMLLAKHIQSFMPLYLASGLSF